MSAILLNQAIIHYEALGRGRPIVFLHGWVGSWRYWMSSMQVASTSYRAYALDLFGYGDTTHDPLSYSLEKQAALLTGFLDEMGIGKDRHRRAWPGRPGGRSILQPSSLAAWIASWRSTARLISIQCMPGSKLRAATELVDWLSSRTAEAAGRPLRRFQVRSPRSLWLDEQLSGRWTLQSIPRRECALSAGLRSE